MSQVTIILPDNSTKVFNHEPTALEVAQSIGPRLGKETLGVKINGSNEISDLRTVLKDQTKVALVTTKSPEAVEVIRHTAAHVMADAVQKLWPEVKVTIGPVIDNGFYYDFDSPFTFTEEHFEKIEKEMANIVAKDLVIRREDWPISKAIETFKGMKERFKVELIESLAEKGETTVGIYYNGDGWFDLCRGPHIQTTGQIKAFKLLSVAGAYWRGDEKNAQLQRIYATAFNDKKDLELYLHNIEEAKKRDHRKLGKELGLFYFNELAPGSPFFTGKGATVYTALQTYLRELYMETGYQEVITPQIFDVNLFHTSGHYQNYKENMFFTKVDERDFASKPMNCPSHCLLFNSDKYSYRDLPVKMADFGRLHRYEKSGAMHGLTRVRTFCQDDAHIFCRLDQLQEEIAKFMQLLNRVYDKLGMSNYKIFLSTRPENRMGSEEYWDMAEGALAEALKTLNLPFEINPGDGAFYGPKLDIMFVDALSRPWQLGTLQVDPNLPQAFDLKYTGEDNKEHRPVMLHRAILGSLERFIGVYLEHTAGHLPPWLAPVQVSILNVTDRVNGFCDELMTLLKADKVRVEFDRRNEKLNYKIREAQLQKVPYMIIVGDKEAESRTVSLRLRDGSEHKGLSVEHVKEMIVNDINQRLLQASLMKPATT
ncbi:threonine--tRNA ligase [Bdellovibrio bacteriovorus]|uniref:Threonine--tRNA ligase n=1 Tax=Bdellovibrio bacteriovorus TaxID=959 RepID=A0A150WLP9_BDEBC|nr:threonine--tRNA ligase [Bdellovibrio bacteriovorus]KYG64864.1 threonine--tRNA ligase [Bdellovibrio bacteriovorus]